MPAKPAELLTPSPVPTQNVSNGEYPPLAQTPQQRLVQSKINADSTFDESFNAMNTVYGPGFVYSNYGDLSKQFVFDVQTHLLKDGYKNPQQLAHRQYAHNYLNSDVERYPTFDAQKFDNYIKEIYLDSDTKLALISGTPGDSADEDLIDNDSIKWASTVINNVCGSKRSFSHSIIQPKVPGYLDEVDYAIEVLQPDSWKCYTIGTFAYPTRRNKQFRLDDEKLVYPWFERAERAGIKNICVHKGLLPPDYRESWRDLWEYSTVQDLAKAARDWPNLNFIIYHSALRISHENPEDILKNFVKTGRIEWTTDLCDIVHKYGLKNVYAELGTSFGSMVVLNPLVASAWLGQMLNMMGEDRILWGTDSVWYGSPQWQIEALRRLEVPDHIMHRMGWDKNLGEPDGTVKQKIFGLNAARLYNVDVASAINDIDSSKIEKMRLGHSEPRNNRYYGYIA